MKKSHIIVAAVIISIAIYIGVRSSSKLLASTPDAKTGFMNTWMAAGEAKYEEQTLKQQADELTKKSEAARLKKESILAGTGFQN